MVLEEIVSAATARKHPFNIIFMSATLSTFGIWLAFYLFEEHTSVLAMAFATVGFVPIMHEILAEEEEEEAEHPGRTITFMSRHFDIVAIYAWLFIGLLISYSFWYVVLPAQKEVNCVGDFCFPVPGRENVFKEQSKAWQYISGEATGNISKASCLDQKRRDLFNCSLFIFANNAGVLVVAILVSFLYGAGAIWLIEWNASVIGIFIGKEILEKNLGAGIARAIGYLPHGIPEIAAYFIGAIAGGVISAMIGKKRYLKHEPMIIAKDVAFMIVLAFLVLLVAAVIESWLIVGGV